MSFVGKTLLFLNYQIVSLTSKLKTSFSTTLHAVCAEEASLTILNVNGSPKIQVACTHFERNAE